MGQQDAGQGGAEAEAQAAAGVQQGVAGGVQAAGQPLAQGQVAGGEQCRVQGAGRQEERGEGDQPGARRDGCAADECGHRDQQDEAL